VYLGREGYKLYKLRFRYFKSFWNWVEIFQVVFSVAAVVVYIVQSDRVTSTIRKLQENVYGNVSFQEAIVWREVENALLGVLIFIVTIKFLRLIRFNTHVAVFSKTLKICVSHLSSFSVILLTLFVAFLHFGILSFGAGSERYSSVLKASYFQLELTLGRVKARPINDLALTNETFGRIFAATILTIITILAMNFFIVILNDALAEAENTVKESQLYDLVDERDWKTTNQRKEFFDAISYGLRQQKIKETLATSNKFKAEVVAPPERNSRNCTAINFDLISQAIKASKEQRIKTSGNVELSNKRRKSFFDRVSDIIGYLRQARYEYRRNLTKKEKKVRFAEDVTKCQLRRLQKTKKTLFKRLDSIIQGYSQETEREEKFLLLCHEMGHKS
jgi:hypothetical protein